MKEEGRKGGKEQGKGRGKGLPGPTFSRTLEIV